jgi:large subunit ribosomal protein L9
MQKIDVVLLQDYKSLGKRYDVVAVKPIYARNVLFPAWVARFADKGAMNDLKAKMESHKKSQLSLVEKLKAMVEKLKESGISISAEANEAGKLYGKVHAKDIAAKLTKEFDVEVTPSYLHMTDIETQGTTTVKFNGEGVIGSFELTVSK